MNSSPKRLTYAIMLGLVLWGIYLAVGATGFFVQPSATNPRKSLIVVVCMAGFLCLWAYVLRSRPASDATRPGTSADTALPWSKSGLITVCLLLLGLSLWFAAVTTWESVERSTTTILGWWAALCMTLSCTSGIISLSHRQRRRGKSLGWIGLIGMAGALIGFVARMSP